VDLFGFKSRAVAETLKQMALERRIRPQDMFSWNISQGMRNAAREFVVILDADLGPATQVNGRWRAKRATGVVHRRIDANNGLLSGDPSTPIVSTDIIPQRDDTGHCVRRQVFNVIPSRSFPSCEPVICAQDVFGDLYVIEGKASNTEVTTTTPATGCPGTCTHEWNGTTWDLTLDGCQTTTTTTTADPSTTTTTTNLSTTTTEDCNCGTTTTAAPTTSEECHCAYPVYCGTEVGECTHTPCVLHEPDTEIECTTTTEYTCDVSCHQICEGGVWVLDPSVDGEQIEDEDEDPIIGEDEVPLEDPASEGCTGCDCPELGDGCGPDGTTREMSCSTTTTTTCDCNTTTLIPPDCEDCCSWIYIPGEGWVILEDNCPEICPCEPPGDEVPKIYCSVVVQDGGGGIILEPRPVTPCSDQCVFWCIPELQSWRQSRDCGEDVSSDCNCPYPSEPCLEDDPCGPTFTRCQAPTTTSPACEDCYPTTTTSETTTTPHCQECKLRFTGGDWEIIENCSPSNCICPVPATDGDGCILKVPCIDDIPTTTSTTTTETTTTTCNNNICLYVFNGSTWALVYSCVCGDCPDPSTECMPCNPSVGTGWGLWCEGEEIPDPLSNYDPENCPQGTAVDPADCTTTTTTGCPGGGSCQYTCNGAINTWELIIQTCPDEGCGCEDPMSQYGHPCSMANNGVTEATACIFGGETTPPP